MRLLVIDDEPHIRQMMRLTLDAASYEVDDEANGEDGLARFGDGRRYAAVLLDQKMPGLDGLETLRRLRERDADARVLVVTAFASIQLAVDAMRLGATDFLQKPMTPDALRGAVAAALARVAAPPQRHGSARPADAPAIKTLTLNGFQILDAPGPRDEASPDHVFRVTHVPDGAEYTVVVAIDPEILARVNRLCRRALPPGGPFWRRQAEQRLFAHLWAEGPAVRPARLVVRDVSRDDIERAAADQFD